MVLLVITPRILSAIEAVPSPRRKDLDLPESPGLNAAISHEQLIGLSRHLKSSVEDGDRVPWTLNTLLRGTKVYVPPPPKKPEPSPEYLAQKARLLAAAEADAYNRLVARPSSNTQGSSIFSSSTPMLSSLHDPNNMMTSDASAPDPLTPSLVLNIFLSVLLTGFSVYWALSKFSTPDLLTSTVAGVWQPNRQQLNVRGLSEPVRVLLSLAVALIVGIAEVVIYAIYWGKAEDARTREKKLKERKAVVGSEQIGGRGESEKTDGPMHTQAAVDANDGKQEEKIWGRGANGGIRRRVREKWEEQEKGREREQEPERKGL